MRRRSASIVLGCTLLLVPAPTAAGFAPAPTAAEAGAVTIVAAAPPVTGSAGAGASATQVHAARTVVRTKKANKRIKRVLRTRTRSRVLGSRFTMTVWDTAKSKYVYKKRAYSSLRGASTTKILTAVGVLATMGPDRRMPTTVRSGASADEVVLVAGGDPLLTSADLRTLAARTAEALGAAPAGTPSPSPSGTATAQSTREIVVRADDSLFSSEGRSRGWRSSWVPSQVRYVRAFARDDRKVRDATADAGAYFASALRALGVSATYAGEATADPAATTLAGIDGHTAAEAVSHMLLVSDNDTAEMLFRHIAVARGLPGTWADARRAQADTLRELRVPLSGVRIIDGSGLSTTGRVTAYSLTSALNRALSPKHPELSGLRGWLPVAGRTGTLRASYGRYNSWPARCAAGQVQAKTGPLADAISLAGYAAGADGKTKIFVSIVNKRPTRYSRLTTRKYVDRAVSSLTGCW